LHRAVGTIAINTKLTHFFLLVCSEKPGVVGSELNEPLRKQVDGPGFPVTRSGDLEVSLYSEPQLDAGITPGLATTTGAAANRLVQGAAKVTRGGIRIKPLWE
jgi:hypothetical protein